jgi:type II secretory pathway pseudopilin PulG
MVFHHPWEQAHFDGVCRIGGAVKNVRTSLLVALLIVAAVAALLGASQLQSAKARAQTAAQDLAVCRTYLTDLRAARSQPSDVTALSTNGSGINQLLRDAAQQASASSSLTSIEPGQPARIEGTDCDETPVFLRLEGTPMKQLVTFLHTASARDPRARCRSIELSAVDGPDAWTADVTLGYLSYSPRGSEKR